MTTMARVTCPCGMEVELPQGRHQDGLFWEVWDPEDMPEPLPPGEVLIDEFFREKSSAVGFADVIECACGRRWRGGLDPPQVVEDGAAVSAAMTSRDDDRWHFHSAKPHCHWCYHRDTAFVWGPYDTNVCAVGQELIEAGRQGEAVEALAAQMTVRGRWLWLDPEPVA